ncbi:unnamed protein product, partial [Cylicostephanus goldi]
MRATGKAHSHDLKQILPGFFATEEVEDDQYSLPLWGTNHYLRSIYTLEYGDLASFDGIRVISSLANLQNCTLSEGFCVLKEEIIMWEPVTSPSLCPYKFAGSFNSYVTSKFALIPQSELAFEFYSDTYAYAEIATRCGFSGFSLTTSHHILIFPQLPAHLSLQRYILEESLHRRGRREIRYITDSTGARSSYEIVPKQSEPLIRRLFGITELTRLPFFATAPIREPRILREMERWNVTNRDFQLRRRLYAAEDPRLTVLRTIRYSEYRWKQLIEFEEIRKTRMLTYAEFSTQRDLQMGISAIFDDYLAEEFGPARIVFGNDTSTIPIPFYVITTSPVRDLPPIPTTTTTPMMTTTTTKRTTTIKPYSDATDYPDDYVADTFQVDYA